MKCHKMGRTIIGEGHAQPGVDPGGDRAFADVTSDLKQARL